MDWKSNLKRKQKRRKHKNKGLHKKKKPEKQQNIKLLQNGNAKMTLNLGKIEFGKNIILQEKKPGISNRVDGSVMRKAALPELMKEYVANPRLFSSRIMENISIWTSSNEILGRDLEGRIYGKNDRIIVQTHGFNIASKERKSLNKKILNETEFMYLLRGFVLTDDNKPVNVYREDQISKISGKEKQRCIIVLPAEKYFRDPSLFCLDLEYTQREYGMKNNGLLLARTLQKPSDLMKLINYVDYFRQTSPLIEEPVLIKGSEPLFEKYAYQILPLILSDGEIIKEAAGRVDFFDGTVMQRNTNEDYVAMTKKFE